MSDFKMTNKVVQSNKLIQQTNWSLNQTSLKLLKIAISCINTNKTKNKVTIKKNELMKFINTNDSHNYTYLRAQLKKLGTFIQVKNDDKSIKDIILVSSIEWEKEKDNIIIEFHKDLMPYLIHLNLNFLQYEVGNLKAFNSKYALIIYEYLLSSIRREPFKNEFYISIDSLRNLTATSNKYNDFRNFEKKVLLIAKKEINNNQLEIIIDYKKIKEVRAITSILFKVRYRNSYHEKEYEEVIKIENSTLG